MRVFGITGGSGSGKTSVSEILASFGVEIIDTDTIAHEIVKPGMPCLAELTDCFGHEILNGDGSLNRKRLASAAFSNEEKRAALNKITHAYIKAETEKRIRESDAELAAIDGAVIIGSAIEPLCEFIVSVIADRGVRAERIKSRDLLDDTEAEQRLAAQPDDEFYIRHSAYIIYNNGDTEMLRNRAAALYNKIKGV